MRQQRKQFLLACVAVLFCGMFVVASGQAQTAPAPAATSGSGLVSQLSKGLSITRPQASGGAGALFALAKTRLSPDEFGKVSSAVQHEQLAQGGSHSIRKPRAIEHGKRSSRKHGSDGRSRGSLSQTRSVPRDGRKIPTDHEQVRRGQRRIEHGCVARKGFEVVGNSDQIPTHS